MVEGHIAVKDAKKLNNFNVIIFIVLLNYKKMIICFFKTSKLKIIANNFFNNIYSQYL